MFLNFQSKKKSSHTGNNVFITVQKFGIDKADIPDLARVRRRRMPT